MGQKATKYIREGGILFMSKDQTKKEVLRLLYVELGPRAYKLINDLLDADSEFLSIL